MVLMDGDSEWYSWVLLRSFNVHTWNQPVGGESKVPRNSWYSFYRPRKDERLSRPWSHSVVLNTIPLDVEYGALTSRSFAPQWRLHLNMVASEWKVHFEFKMNVVIFYVKLKVQLKIFLHIIPSKIFPYSVNRAPLFYRKWFSSSK